MQKTRTSKKKQNGSANKSHPKLTARQKMVLDFIVNTIENHGYPPTLREIGNHMDIRSTNGVNDHLKALERKGYLKKGSLRARALTPIIPEEKKRASTLTVPVVGKVAAGIPIQRIESCETSIQIDRQLLGHHEDIFALRVSGDSMIEEGIKENDIVFVRPQSDANNGDVVVFVIDNEATIKRFYRQKNTIRLQPANSNMEPMILTPSEWQEMEIIGVLVGFYHKY